MKKKIIAVEIISVFLLTGLSLSGVGMKTNNCDEDSNLKILGGTIISGDIYFGDSETSNYKSVDMCVETLDPWNQNYYWHCGARSRYSIDLSQMSPPFQGEINLAAGSSKLSPWEDNRNKLFKITQVRDENLGGQWEEVTDGFYYTDTDHIDNDIDILIVEVPNNPPEIPSTPDGQKKGSPGTEYSYSTSTTDPDGDRISYGWDWDGDGVVDYWDKNKVSWREEYYASGAIATASNTWENEGTYEIRVKAKDCFGAESDFSQPLSVSMPKSRPAHPILSNILSKILENRPILQLLAERLLGL